MVDIHADIKKDRQINIAQSTWLVILSKRTHILLDLPRHLQQLHIFAQSIPFLTIFNSRRVLKTVIQFACLIRLHCVSEVIQRESESVRVKERKRGLAYMEAIEILRHMYADIPYMRTCTFIYCTWHAF